MKKTTGLSFKDKLVENIKSILIAVIAAMILRTFAYEPFKIPSSSMVPSMLIGDFLFVSKYSYGYSNKGSFFRLPILDENSRVLALGKPKRGDVVVFKLPSNPKINYIKRVIGLPGDTVQIKDEIVYINGKPLKREFIGEFYDNDTDRTSREYKEITFEGKEYNVIEHQNNSSLDNTDVFSVPEGHYFVMGDNRDNSADCRTSNIAYPFVPIENFVGKAEIIFFSIDYKDFKPRFNRLLNKII